MTLAADVEVQVGDFTLEVSLELGSGEVLALMGPNGAGKSTLVRALAGLQPIMRGRIELDGSVLDEPTGGTFVPPEQRPVGVVFQDYLLFPHLSVIDNVAFGPRARGVPKSAATAAAIEWIQRVGLGELGAAKPRDISGGQAQRVALARALVNSPRLLLLDEPLAALDITTRASVRRGLRRHLGEFGGATIMVTHDPLDALALADHVAVLEAGRLTQYGTIAEVTAHPRRGYVADLLGVNLLEGTGSAHEVRLQGGVSVATADAVDGPTLVLIRPNSVTLQRTRPDSSARNNWRLAVEGFDLLGDRMRVRLRGDLSLIAEVTPAALTALAVAEGERLWATVKATDVTVYPA